jgi:hypothetical protein
MPCKQIFTNRQPAMSNSVANYLGPTFGGEAWQASTFAPVPWQIAGSFRYAGIALASAPGAGNSIAFTMVKNGVDTSLTITITDSATSGTDFVHTVSVTPGDLLYWRCTPTSSPTVSACQLTVEFWGTVIGESGYGNMDLLSNSQTWRTPMFNQGVWNTGNGGTSNHEVVAVAGDLKALSYNLSAAPGGGKSYLIQLYKNGTLQNGSGGTVDTRVTIADSATTGSWSGTLTLAAGDYVYLESVPSGTPAAAKVGAGVKFLATTDGESQGGMLTFFNLPTSGTTYSKPMQYYTTWDATEANVLVTHQGNTPFLVRGLRVRTGLTIGTGPVAFTIRRNGASSGITCSITVGNQTGADTTHSVIMSLGDTWSIEYVATASPGAARIASVGFVQYAQYEVAKTGSFAIGYQAYVVGVSRAGCISLNGNTNINTETGKLMLGGDLNLLGILELKDGQAVPPAQALKAKIYVDAADGDLKIIFADGTVKTIVTDT